MEGKRCDIGLMSFQLKFRRSDGYVEVIGIDIDWALFNRSLWHLLEVLNLFFQVSYFLLQ